MHSLIFAPALARSKRSSTVDPLRVVRSYSSGLCFNATLVSTPEGLPHQPVWQTSPPTPPLPATACPPASRDSLHGLHHRLAYSCTHICLISLLTPPPTERQAPLGWALFVFICVLFTAVSLALRIDLAQSWNSFIVSTLGRKKFRLSEAK